MKTWPDWLLDLAFDNDNIPGHWGFWKTLIFKLKKRHRT